VSREANDPRHSVEPSPGRIQGFVAAEDDGAPLVMINLLRYRERARYPAGAGADPCSGREAYQRYAAVALQKVASVGGRIVWMGQVAASVIAPEGEEWDDAALVEYPSRKAFLAMIAMPDYQAAAVHRTAALEDSRLIATRARSGAPA
jgi:uncharacterized protein (DUF1330 family)